MAKEKNKIVVAIPAASPMNGKTIKTLVNSFINDVDKVSKGGVQLLKELASEKLPLEFALTFFQADKSWPKNPDLSPVGINAATGKAVSAYNALRKAAQRYAGEGKGSKYIASLDANMELLPVEKKATGRPSGSTSEEVQEPTKKDLETVAVDATKKANRIFKLTVLAFIDKERSANPSDETLDALNRLKKEVEGLKG